MELHVTTYNRFMVHCPKEAFWRREPDGKGFEEVSKTSEGTVLRRGAGTRAKACRALAAAGKCAEGGVVSHLLFGPGPAWPHTNTSLHGAKVVAGEGCRPS